MALYLDAIFGKMLKKEVVPSFKLWTQVTTREGKVVGRADIKTNLFVRPVLEPGLWSCPNQAPPPNPNQRRKNEQKQHSKVFIVLIQVHVGSSALKLSQTVLP